MFIRNALVFGAVTGFGTCCLGQISSVTQERSVSSSTSVSSGASHDDFAEASNYNPFVRTVSTTTTGANGARSDCTASQNSAMSATSITGVLDSNCSVVTGSSFVVGEADGSSSYLYIFNLDVATEVHFTAEGSLSYIGRNPDGEPSDLYGMASVRLVDGITEDQIAGFFLFPDAGTDSATFDGTLPAGQYVIMARANIHGYSADLIGPPPRSGSGTAHVSFSLTAGTPCAADFNHDDTVDFFDYLDFVDAFSQNDPSADFNGDHVIDFFDYLDFVDAFSAGC